MQESTPRIERAFGVSAVLVHGAGDTAAVWAELQQMLRVPSHALDIIGRESRPYDLVEVTVDRAVERAVADISSSTSGPVVLVAHSIGGALSPGIAAALASRVVHLVHVVAIAAPDGEMPLAVASQDFADLMLTGADALRNEMRGATFAEDDMEVPLGLRRTADRLALTRIDSVNLGCVPTSWVGVDPDLPRTFVQTVRDRLYPLDAQARLAAVMGADEIIPLESGHNPARSAASELAAIIDGIAGRYAS